MEGTETAGNGDHVTAEAILLREIEAIDVRLRFLTIGGYDGRTRSPYRDELLSRRAQLERELGKLPQVHPPE
jgi:hypothetical protein